MRICLPLVSFLLSCASGESIAVNPSGPGPGITSAGLPDLPPSEIPTSESPEIPTTNPYPEISPDLPKVPESEDTTGGTTSTLSGQTLVEGSSSTTEIAASTSEGSSTGSDSGGMINEPQPRDGLFAQCLSNAECNPGNTDGCFIILNGDQRVEDGFCTLLCRDVNDCGVAPDVPADLVCDQMGRDQKVCALLCVQDEDCPQGMLCKEVKDVGFFCL